MSFQSMRKDCIVIKESFNLYDIEIFICFVTHYFIKDIVKRFKRHVP